MDEEEPDLPVGEYLVRGLIRALLREGILSEDAVRAASDELTAEGTENSEQAALVMLVEILASRPEVDGPPIDPAREQRRIDMIKRTKYIEHHGHMPPKTMDEAFDRLRARQAAARSDGGNGTD